MAQKEKLEKAKEVQPEVAPEAVAVAPKKKNNVFVVIGIVFAAIVVLVGAVVGYGFYNGGQIRKYAATGETLYATTDDWDEAFGEDDTDKVKSNIEEIKRESDSALETLNKKSAPGKAKQLESDLKEYFTISKRVAVDAETIVNWISEVEDITKDFSNMSSMNTSTPQAMAASIDSAKKDIDASIVRLKELTVPESIKPQHEAFLEMLENMSVMYSKLSAALRKNDINALTSITGDFSKIADGFDDVESVDDTISKSWEKDEDRLKVLDGNIDNAIKNLKTVKFSF